MLIAYSAILIKVMVFKDLPTIRVGQLMLNFTGTDAGHAPNFVPLKTIAPYLLGFKGWIIAGVNLVGNIALLVPIGLLVPFVSRNMGWKKALALGALAGLSIEVMQTVLRVGIFDIDDVLLNALGVMIGYGVSVTLIRWMRSRNYKKILITASITVALAGVLYGAVIYPITHQSVRPEARAGEDLCGGTGGAGQIISAGANAFTIERKDGSSQRIILADGAEIHTSAGPASPSALKPRERVTLVGGPNPDGSFTAETVFVCSAAGPETKAGEQY